MPEGSFHQWKLPCIILLILFGQSVQTTKAKGDCNCEGKLALEIARSLGWYSLNFIHFTSSDSFTPDACGPTPWILLHVFGDSKSYSVIHLPPRNFTSEMISTLVRKQNFVVSYSDQLSLLFTQANGISNFFGTTAWAILVNGENELKKIKDLAKTLDIFVNSNFFLFEVSRCSESVELYSIYRVGERVETLLEEKGGQWTDLEGFQSPFLNTSIIKRRGDFYGYPMKGIGVAVFPHFTTYREDGTITGFVGELINMLKKSHNFTLTYDVLDGYAYGKLIDGDREANQWTGMVGELQRKKVDLTISELSITRERTEVVSYTQPLYIISRKMYVGVHVDTRQKLLTYATPMEPILYVVVFIMITFLTFALSFASYLQRKLLPSWVHMDHISLRKSSWVMMSALMQQGVSSTPEGLCTRMVFWYGFMLSFVVYIAYSATLVAQLAVVLPVPLPFQDFYGLVQQNGWDAGNVKDDLFEVIASQTCAGDSKEECRILQEVWHQNILRTDGNLVQTYVEGLQRAREDNYVFIGVDVTTNNYIKQLPLSDACSIKELPPKYITGGIGIGVQHQSPFLQIFDRSLQSLKEMGIMEKMVKKWLKVEVKCVPSSIVSADMTDLASVFTLLIMGIGVAFVVFAVEHIMSRRINETARVDS